MSAAVDTFPSRPHLPRRVSHHRALMMVIIGRATDCDIVLDHNTVSRRHAVLIRSHHGWTIEDLGSTNGTAVNGVRIRDRRSVRVGDVLQFGATARRLGRDGLCDD